MYNLTRLRGKVTWFMDYQKSAFVVPVSITRFDEKFTEFPEIIV